MMRGEVGAPLGACCPLGVASRSSYIYIYGWRSSHNTLIPPSLICPLVGIFLPLLADPVSRVRCLGEALLKIFSTTITYVVVLLEFPRIHYFRCPTGARGGRRR